MAFLNSMLPGRSADYTTICRRICCLHIGVSRIEPGMKIIFAVDSTGLRVGHGGEWLRAKHGAGNKGALIKLHIGTDFDTSMIAACVITEDAVHDSQCMEKLVEQAERSCGIDEVLADGGYGANGIFQMLDDKGRARDAGQGKLKVGYGLPRQTARGQGPGGPVRLKKNEGYRRTWSGCLWCSRRYSARPYKPGR